MKRSTLFILLVVSFASCQRDNAHQKKESYYNQILDLHESQRDIHFEKRVDNFADLLSEQHVSVNRGEIKQPSKDELKTRFTNYFNSVEFVKWDDLRPPTIRFSEDSTIAYTVVEKEVIVRPIDSTRLDTTIFSWVAIYKRSQGEWKIDCVASTNK